MSASPTILVDVRTPAEFATGFLSTNGADAVNIEYQLIEQLPHIYSEAGIDVQKTDLITLYCRSGRRSNIALQALKQLGYSNVRDIGAFEHAREVLGREDALRIAGREDTSEAVISQHKDPQRHEERQRAFGSLVAGLKSMECAS